MQNDIFDELFILELANNHWGKIERGLKIINDVSKIVRFNSIRVAIKLQFRHIDTFIHKDYTQRSDIRYIKKSIATKMNEQQYGILINAIIKNGCIPMATPFDEQSVELCVKFDLPIIKLASSDLNDWILIEAIAKTKKPVIASTGGGSLKDMDDLVHFFERRNIPLSLNHCVSLYPSEDNELEINQIDFLKNRYAGHVIGFSTHEYHDWTNSMLLSYAKGARTWERHIDIDADDIPVAPYCSLPHQLDTWFKAFYKAKEMCGGAGIQKRVPPLREIRYLDDTVRGVYAKSDLPKHHKINVNDVYLAIPMLQGQISCRELMEGETLIHDIKKDKPIFIDDLDSPYAYNNLLRSYIYERGISPTAPVVSRTKPKKKNDKGNK